MGKDRLAVLLHIVGDPRPAPGDLEVAPVFRRHRLRLDLGRLPHPKPVDADTLAARRRLAIRLAHVPDGLDSLRQRYGRGRLCGRLRLNPGRRPKTRDHSDAQTEYGCRFHHEPILSTEPLFFLYRTRMLKTLTERQLPACHSREGGNPDLSMKRWLHYSTRRRRDRPAEIVWPVGGPRSHAAIDPHAKTRRRQGILRNSLLPGGFGGIMGREIPVLNTGRCAK